MFQKVAKNGGLPLTLTVALTTGQHYPAACDQVSFVAWWCDS